MFQRGVVEGDLVLACKLLWQIGLKVDEYLTLCTSDAALAPIIGEAIGFCRMEIIPVMSAGLVFVTPAADVDHGTIKQRSEFS